MKFILDWIISHVSDQCIPMSSYVYSCLSDVQLSQRIPTQVSLIPNWWFQPWQNMFPKRVFDPIIYIDNLTIQPFTSNGAHNKHKKNKVSLRHPGKLRPYYSDYSNPPSPFLHILAPLVLSHPHLKTTVLWGHHHNIRKRMGRRVVSDPKNQRSQQGHASK